MDLVQQGNWGLIEAVHRYDNSQEAKFITYAVYYIKAYIYKHIDEQADLIRFPLNQIQKLRKLRRVSREYFTETGRGPTIIQYAYEMDCSEEEVERLKEMPTIRVGLEEIIEDDRDELKCYIDQDFIERHELLREIEKAFDSLTPREAEVLNLYFGLYNDLSLTFDEIAARFSLTRERIRQIKEKAIRRMRHASRSRSLRAYLV